MHRLLISNVSKAAMQLKQSQIGSMDVIHDVPGENICENDNRIARPTPLYFMDEIDAALDFRNVSIIANYIKATR